MTAPRTPTPGRLTTAIRAIAEPVARRVMVIDDEETIRSALARFLRGRGFEVTTADSGEAALDAIRREKFVGALCDIRMPGLSGIEVVPLLLKEDSDLAIVMLTAVNDAPTATEALSLGAMDYLMKPAELGDLASALERALHKRSLSIEQRRVERLIRDEVAAQTEELLHERKLLQSMVLDTVQALVRAQEAKDSYFRGHSDRVADLAASIATHLGLADDDIEALRLAARVMDVGKIGIREEVLNKPSQLTPEEFEHIKSHVAVGVEILSSIKPLAHVLTAVSHHHEHWDGRGYPAGLAGESISLGGRILAAADAFDALTSARPWRDPMSPKEAIDYLGGLAGALLEPRVFEALRAVVTRRRTLQFLDPGLT